MSLLRFLSLLSLVTWLGGLVFFAFVLAPTVFAVLPTHEMAGRVVSRSLTALHWIGVVSGLVYLVSSLAYAHLATGQTSVFAARHLLVLLMLLLTLTSQVAIGGRMQVLRAEMGVIDDVPVNDSRRVEFNRLHHWSTRLEGGVLLCGLAVLYLTARAH